MNGAMAELCARIRSSAKMPRVIRIGVIHQRLLFQKKLNNSPAVPKRCPVVLKKPIIPPNLPPVGHTDVVAEHKSVARPVPPSPPPKRTRPPEPFTAPKTRQSLG